MLAHPIFPNLLMHSDEELSYILGATIVKRKTIHEWPLSCVQELLLHDGRKLIYKSQLPPTVEPNFYEHASSKLLPGHRVLGNLGDCNIMIIDWIDAPLLSEKVLSDIELLEHGKRIIAQINEIVGELPTYLNIGSAEAWSSVAQITIDKLRKLVIDKRFRLINLDAVEHVRTWSKSDRVFETITGNPHVIHGDLKADQVFITADGYRIIDWQRPVVAPPDVDLVALLVGQHIEPRYFIDKTIVDIFWFLRLHWAVEAQFSLFPDNRWPLFDQWASEAIEHILVI